MQESQIVNPLESTATIIPLVSDGQEKAAPAQPGPIPNPQTLTGVVPGPIKGKKSG